MSRITVLLDFLDDNVRRYQRILADCDDDCLHWQPDPQANSIAVTIWHVARVQDMFRRQALGTPQASELWFSAGWAEKTGYDPRGSGHEGWGVVIGYTKEEVGAVPAFSQETLLDYFNAINDTVRAWIVELGEAGLDQLAVGFGGQRTIYDLVRIPLLDMTRHMGEIYALQAMWERRQARDE